MADCANLMERFGDRYRVTFEPADDRQRREIVDPWLYEMKGRRGTIYPHGGNLLAVEIDGHRFVRSALRQLGCQVHTEGDDCGTYLFDVADFDKVAEIVMPYRRPALTEARREELRQQAAKARSVRLVDLSLSDTPASAKA